MSDRVAALDLGSNSFHLLVADVLPAGRGIKRVDTRKLTLRLAEPVARTGQLGRDARKRALEAVGELVATARRAGATRVVAVATEALRVADDGDRLRRDLHTAHGLKVRLLEGLEEAALSLCGMAGALSLRPGEDLLGLDLGGGSFEVAYGRGGSLEAGLSLPLGSARLLTREGHDPLWLAERIALHQETTVQLEPLGTQVAELRGENGSQPLRAAGTAGTIRDLGRVSLALAGGATPERVRGLVVTRAQLEVAYARIVSMTTAERLGLPGLSAKRADLMPAGGAVLLATMAAFGLDQLELCDWGLREGALLDALDGGHTLSESDVAPLR